MFTIITTSAFVCPWCVKAKELLNEYGIEYHEYDVQTDEESKDMMRHYGLKTVPQIWDGMNHIGGYSDLVTYLENVNEIT